MGILKNTLLTVLFVLTLFGCASHDIKAVSDYQYTYESEISPAVFMEWEIVESEYYTDGENKFAQYIMANPDTLSPIRIVVTVVIVRKDASYQLISYGYNKNGVDYVYVLDIDTNRYRLWMSRPSVKNIRYFIEEGRSKK